MTASRFPPFVSWWFPMLAAKNLAQNGTASREWFRDILWLAFPARSDSERAGKIASALGVSKRQAQNWLGCHNDAALRYVAAVLLIAGAEAAFARLGARG